MLDSLIWNWGIVRPVSHLTSTDRTIISDIRNNPWLINYPEPLGQTIVLAMLNVSARHCSDPRDRIFALRNILNIEDTDEFRPDYGLNPATLYRRFVSHCFLAQNCIWSCCHAALALALNNTEAEDLEGGECVSWVPNLSALTSVSRGTACLYDQ